MTTSGLIVMLLSVGTVTLLFGWCVAKVLSTPHESEKIHGMDLHEPGRDADR